MNTIKARAKMISWLSVATFVMFVNCCVTHAETQYSSGSFDWDDGVTPAWSAISGGTYNLVWTNGNDAVFEGLAGTVSITPAGVSAQNLTFNTAGFTVSSNTLTFTGTPLVTANATAVISADTAGTAGLTKAGDADLTLSGTNVYSGATRVTAGLLQIGDGSANPALNTAIYTVTNGATLKLFTDGAWDVAGQQLFFANIRGDGTLLLDSTAKVDWPGSGTQFYMNFDDGFTGNLVIDRGRVPSNTGGMGSISSVTVNAGGQFASWNGATISQDFTIAGYYGDEASQDAAMRTSNRDKISTYNGSITLSDSAAISAEGITYFNGVVDGPAGIDLTCFANNFTGTLVMCADNTYLGSTTLKNGVTLQLGNGGSTGSLPPSSAINLLSANTYLKINRTNTVAQGTDFGIVNGSGGIVKAGSGTLYLNFINSYTGSTVVEDGTLKLEAPSQAFRYYKFHVTQNDGANTYNQFSELHFYSNGVWTAASGGSPATTLNNGENHWTKANDNSKDTKFGQTGVPYELTYDFGTPRFFDSYNWATANDQTPSRNPVRWIVYGSNDNSTWSILSDMSDWGETGPTTTHTWAGVSDANYLPVVNGALAGGAANAYPLVTSIGIQPISSETSVAIADSGTLDLNGLNITIGALTDAGTITNSGGSPVTLTVNQADDSFFSGAIVDNGANAISLIKSGTGTLSLFGLNTYSGLTVIEGGTVRIGSGFQYYKFEVASAYTDANGYQYSEMAFFSSGTNPDNGNRVIPVTATGDGGIFKDGGLSALYDNILTTKSFMDSPFPRYVVYDFGAPEYFTGYAWATANDATPARNPNDWTIQGSNDGSTWTTLDTQTNSGATPTSTYTYADGWELTPYSSQQCSLPSATTVQISDGATLDLAGSSQIIAVLSGSGLVSNGTLAVTGAIMPGGADEIGTLSLNSTAVSGTMLADVNVDGTSDLLAVEGNIDLSGLSLTIANPDDLLPSKEYTLLTCSSTRSGEFSSSSIPDSWYLAYLPDGSVKLVYSGGTLLIIQ